MRALDGNVLIGLIAMFGQASKLTAGPLGTRERLISAAVTLFQSHGYAGVSIGDILAATDLPKGSLYHHFRGGKEELALAAVTLIDAEVTAFFDGFLRQNKSPSELIHQLAVTISDWLVKTDFRQGALLGSLMGDAIPLALSQHLIAVSEGWLLALTKLWPDDDRAAAKAQLLLSTLEGAIVRSRLARDGTILLTSLSELSDLLA